MWWIDHGELVRKNSERPNVNGLGVLALASDELGSHPVDCAYFRCPLGLLFGELHCDSEIGQLYITVDVIEHVIRFDIPVDDVALM